MNRPPPAPPKNLARKAPPPPNKIKKPTPIRPLIAPDEPEQSMAEPTIEPESVSTALPTQDDSQKQQAPIQNIQRKQEEEAKQEEKEEEEKPAEQENRESVENIDGSSLVEIPVEQAPEAGKKAEIPQPARRPPVVPRKAPPQPLGGKKNVVRPPMPKRPIENLPMAIMEEQPAKLSPEKEFEEQKESQVQVQEDKKKTQAQEIVQQEMIPMQQVSEVAEPIAEHKPEPQPEPEPEPEPISAPQPVPKPETKIQKIKAVPALKKPTPKNKISPSKAIAAPQQQSPKVVSQEDQKKVDQLQSIGKQVRSCEPLLHGSCQLTPKYSNLASKIKSFSARQDELLESSSESEDDEDQPEDKPEHQPEDYKNVDSYSPNRVNSPVRIKDDDDDEVEETPKRQPQQSEIVEETAGFKPNDAIIEIQQNDLEEEPGDKRADQSDEDEDKKLSLSKPLLESISFAHQNLPTRVEPEIEDDEEAVVADRVEEMDEMNNTLATEQFYKESMEFEPVMSPSLSPIMFKTRVSHSKAEESQREMIRLIESQKAQQKSDLNELLESFPLKKQRWEENAVKLKQMSIRHQEEEKQKMEQISQLLDELSRCNMKLKEVMAGI